VGFEVGALGFQAGRGLAHRRDPGMGQARPTLGSAPSQARPTLSWPSPLLWVTASPTSGG
jgi:hypothetical protein